MQMALLNKLIVVAVGGFFLASAATQDARDWAAKNPTRVRRNSN